MKGKLVAIGIILILTIATVQAHSMENLVGTNIGPKPKLNTTMNGVGPKFGHKIARYANHTFNHTIKEEKRVKNALERGKKMAEEKYREAVKEFRRAKEMYKRGNESKKMEMFQRGKQLMYRWSNLCERWIERLMERVKTSNMNEEMKLKIMERLQNALNKVKQVRMDINNTQNITQFRMTVREMREMWMSVRNELRFSAYEYIVWKFDDILERATQLRDRFAALGINVSGIDAKLTQINETISEAKMMLNSNDLKGAAEKIMEARKELRELFQELRMYAMEYANKIRLGGGLVYAKVNGSFEMSGNYTAFIRGIGNVSVTPTTAIMSKVVHENYVKLLVKGEASVTGSGTFRIVVHGKGSVTLNGTGYYRVKPNIGKPMSPEIPINGSVTVTFGE